jgi:murein DD-endopeptidase MepM/ murein hydrolase activator NlpD
MKINIPEEKRIFYIIAASVLLLTLVIFIIYSFKDKSPATSGTEVVKKAPNIDEYGINLDSLTKKEYEIEKNETKSKLLADLGVSNNIAQQIIDKTKDVITTKDYRQGLKFYAYTDKNNQLQNLVFQFGVYRYVLIGLKDSISVVEKKEDVKTTRRTIYAQIDAGGSLYGSLDSLGVASDALVDRIANEIFPTRIDFRKIQAGDSFKIIFDDVTVKGKSVNIGKIYAVQINHMKQDYYALYFEQGKEGSFYDEKANSLKEGFRKSPLKFGRISSKFSLNRLHPVLGYNRPHLGTDYAAPAGTPILAIGKGVVIEKGYNGGFGNMVKIKHNSSYTTQYAHMSKFATGIKKGSVVQQSQVIGYVGSTGLATGPHVDFRFWKNGKLVDHTKEKYPVSMPLDKKYLHAFNSVRDNLMKELKDGTSVQPKKP